MSGQFNVESFYYQKQKVYFFTKINFDSHRFTSILVKTLFENFKTVKIRLSYS